ncbi:hypothetical protein FXN61_41615, partial [Lentzea sp. PSKA42]|nr:hypothetical protein [Lentzea indica]
MSSPAATKGSDSPKLRDDTTRFLCGAAHRDEEFADSAIREYLVEATRSIPRSPGVNAGAVLREAVGARTRRKVRDALLLALAVVVLFAARMPSTASRKVSPIGPGSERHPDAI